MKKVLALMAVVAMVAISSVAYAQTVTVTGSLGATSAALGNCSFAFDSDLSTTKQFKTCTPALTGNTLTGFTISLASDGGANYMDNTGSSTDQINSMAAAETACPATGTDTDCFSMQAVTSSWTGTYSKTDVTHVDTVDLSESPIPAANTLLFTGDLGQITAGETFDMTFWAVTREDQDAGSYQYDGTITVVTP